MRLLCLPVLVVVARLMTRFYFGLASLWTFFGLTSLLTDFGAEMSPGYADGLLLADCGGPNPRNSSEAIPVYLTAFPR